MCMCNTCRRAAGGSSTLREKPDVPPGIHSKQGWQRITPVKARRAHLSQRSVWLCCSTRQSIWEAATWLLATLPAGGASI